MSADRKIDKDYGIIHQVEIGLAAELLPSATTARAARIILGLEGNVEGLKILDAGSGLSPLVAELVESGADAHALDCIYGDDNLVRNAFDRFLPLLLKQWPREHRKEMERRTREAAENFLISYGNEPGRYHSGWITNMPFKDSQFDVTVSLNAISDLGKNWQLLSTAFDEMIRVTRPGGNVIMAPFHHKKKNNAYYTEAHWNLYERINSSGLGGAHIIGPRKGYLDAVLLFRKG